MYAAKSSGKRENCQHFIPFKVFIACKYLVYSHAGTEQFENHFNGVAQITNSGLTMTDILVYGNLFHVPILNRGGYGYRTVWRDGCQ